MNKYISAQEAGSLFNITPHTIRRLGREGIIGIQNEGGINTYSLEDLDSRYKRINKASIKVTTTHEKKDLNPQQKNKPEARTERINSNSTILQTLLAEKNKEIARLCEFIREKEELYLRLQEHYNQRYQTYQEQTRTMYELLEKSQSIQQGQQEQIRTLSEQIRVLTKQNSLPKKIL